MWVTASSTEVLAAAYSAAGTLLTATISTVVIGIVALLGLGFGIRHLKKYITGRKF